MFAWNGRYAAASVQSVDLTDGAVQWKQYPDRLRRGYTKSNTFAGLELQADRCDLHHTFPCGSYQWTSGHASDDGKCRADRALDNDRTEGTGARGQFTSDHCTGASV